MYFKTFKRDSSLLWNIVSYIDWVSTLRLGELRSSHQFCANPFGSGAHFKKKKIISDATTRLSRASVRTKICWWRFCARVRPTRCAPSARPTSSSTATCSTPTSPATAPDRSADSSFWPSTVRTTDFHFGSNESCLSLTGGYQLGPSFHSVLPSFT